ncbi:PASTA domain-containing protein [Microvirga sp. BT688]|uniref:PASTA domain-containing protein n=1 Tax=Microvirga sp. TaxID=1873136 RepID=UPI001684D4E0|nr:PASTA domain-containing protein [Microvirga sp.]MBD2749164.1 PASTA domain-containing protein [Microvirga sp.]
MDPLMPLTAAVVTKDLEPQKRLALTGAALVLNGPLALAPALVAVERARRAPPRPPGAGPIGPELTDVPDVVGQPVDEARKSLTGNGLVPSVSLNRSSERQKDQVLSQDPPRRAGELVETGSVVALRVGAGPDAPIEQDEHGQLSRAVQDLVKTNQELSKAVQELTQRLDRLPPPPPPSAAGEPAPTGRTGSKSG